MQKADQRQIANEANMTLVSIRTAELKYFNTFFSSLGIQAALMVGIITGNIHTYVYIAMRY